MTEEQKPITKINNQMNQNQLIKQSTNQTRMNTIFKKKEDDVVTTVLSTKDYSKFKPLHGNRSLNLGHIRRLTESMKSSHLICPIIVNENYEIIDGQHRLTISKDLGLPVYYIMVTGYGLREVQVFNSNTSTWTKKDYLESYCQMGLRPYLQFKQFMNQFPSFPIVACGQILMDRVRIEKQLGTKHTGLFHSKEFEEGKLVIADLVKATHTAKKIMDFAPFYKGYNRKSFVACMIDLFKNKNYNHDTMIKKLKSCPTKLVNMPDAVSYKLLLEEIYNYKNRNQVSLRYHAK